MGTGWPIYPPDAVIGVDRRRRLPRCGMHLMVVRRSIRRRFLQRTRARIRGASVSRRDALSRPDTLGPPLRLRQVRPVGRSASRPGGAFGDPASSSAVDPLGSAAASLPGVRGSGLAQTRAFPFAVPIVCASALCALRVAAGTQEDGVRRSVHPLSVRRDVSQDALTPGELRWMKPEERPDLVKKLRSYPPRRTTTYCRP